MCTAPLWGLCSQLWSLRACYGITHVGNCSLHYGLHEHGGWTLEPPGKALSDGPSVALVTLESSKTDLNPQPGPLSPWT